MNTVGSNMSNELPDGIEADLSIRQVAARKQLQRVADFRDAHARVIADHVSGVRPLDARTLSWQAAAYLDCRDRYHAIVEEYDAEAAPTSGLEADGMCPV